MNAKYRCPNCGRPVVKARWEKGYEYCTDPNCVRKLGRTKVSVYEQPPGAGEFDVSPMELDDVAALFDSDPED